MSRVCSLCAQGMAEFSCGCSVGGFYCGQHLVVHMSDSGGRHQPVTLFATVNVSVSNEWVGVLNNVKTVIFQDKKKLITFTNKMMKELEGVFTQKLEKLDELSLSVSRIISQLKKNMLPEMSYYTDLDKWFFQQENREKPYVFSLQTVSIEAIVSPYFNIQFSFSQPESSPKKEVMDPNYPQARKRKDSSTEYSNTHSQNSSFSLYEHSAPQNWTCLQKHPLAWNNLLPFRTHSKHKTIWVKCQKCNKQFSRSAWACNECLYAICEECGDSLGHPAPKLACAKGHELEWKADASLFYSKELGSPRVTCKAGNHSMSNAASWHCRKCNFDVCKDCAANSGYRIPAIKPRCTNSHELQLINDPQLSLLLALQGNTLSCQFLDCKKPIDGAYYVCLQCSFFVCVDCGRACSGDAPGHPGIRCVKSHILCWFRASQYICDSCGKKKNEERFRCNLCDFDMCSSCSHNFTNAVKNGVVARCKAGHFMDWDPQTVLKTFGMGWSCQGNCGRTFKRVGSFKCNYCMFNLCIQCVPKDNN